ncbi:20_t:CDS:2 [Gigaspora margarita]|uniref:20_t:CDS:1 n=1 Tax=Gigaspora margarita TaxID=4874 RepID=A0ABN7V4G8_GIGMA|nr:20_t:CDS:2 [Gigaspora margarita]
MNPYNNLINECPNEERINKCLNEERIKFYKYSYFKDVRFIGEGGYGKVHRATLKSNEGIVALKSFKNNVAIEEVVKELKLHNRVGTHSNIIRLLGATKNEDETNPDSIHYMLVLDYADSGTLRSYLKDNFRYLSWDNKINLAVQIASADMVEQHRLIPLAVDIGKGARENPIEGTPSAYVKVYEDCWKHDPDSRPEIREVLLSLQDLSIDGKQAINRIDPDIQQVQQVLLSLQDLNTNDEQVINRIVPDIQQVLSSLQGSSTNGEQAINRINSDIQQVQQAPLSSNNNGEQVINRIDQGIQQVQQAPLSSSINGEQAINRIDQDIQQVQQAPLSSSTNGEQVINKHWFTHPFRTINSYRKSDFPKKFKTR